MDWPVFVTATETSQKALNRAFLLLQDFDFSDEPNEETRWAIISSTTLPDANNRPPPAKIPLPTIPNNSFQNQSLSEINTFVRSNNTALETLKLTTANWLVVDQKGIETQTAIVCQQDYDEEKGEMTDGFRGARVPFVQAHAMFANLDIANMDFEDWVVEDEGVQEDGTWKWVGPEAEEIKYAKEGREKALEEAREKGWIE